MLIIKNLKIFHPAKPKEILLDDINLSLDSSSYKKVALIGKNGSGKTTFIKKLISGDNAIAINHEKIAYLPQHFELTQDTTVKSYFEKQIESAEFYKIEIFLDELSMSKNVLEREISKLSGGQVLKIRLILLLLKDPTILILDEPTNHLDQESKDFLSDFIKNFLGSVLLVSHDRNFLQKTIDQVWSIQSHSKTIDVFTGSYSDWREKQSTFIEKNNQTYQKLQSQINQLKKWLQSNQNHPKYKFSAIVTTKRQKLEKLQTEFKNSKYIQNSNIHLQLNNKSNNYKSNLLITYNFKKHPILKTLSGKIYNSDQILIEGPNGSGKTTFLNSMKSQNDSIIYNKDLNIAYLKQLSDYSQDMTVKELIIKHTQLDTTQIYQKIAQLNLKHLLKQKLKKLSGGEQKRLQVAILLSQKADLYLLDEPTNHLDIHTQEIFQNFLKTLNKPFILVSHDKFLKDDIVFSKKITLPKYE